MEAPAIEITPAIIAAIGARYGLGIHTWVPLPSLGTATTIYLLDDAFVLKVARNHPAYVAGLRIDPLAIPAARAAGVRTPQLVVFDNACDIIPVPYGVYERVVGEPLDRLGLPREAPPQVWRELGRDLALLHTSVSMDGPASQLSPNDVGIDPRPWLYEIMLNGHIDSATFDWLSGWLDRLEFAARMLSPRRFCHGDVNAGNIMVHSETRHYLALLDWGGASWGDATWDFVPVSLSVVPVMLEGYRAVAPLDNNATAEARILWHHVQFAVFGLWKQQQRGQRWAHQQVERLKTNMQGFLALPTTQWIANLR